MLFRKVGGDWRAIKTEDRLEEAIRTAGAGLFLLSIPVLALAIIAVVVFAFLHTGNPIMSTIGLAIQYWHLVIILPAIGALVGFRFGWYTADGKPFQEIAIDVLVSVDKRLESIVEKLDEKQTDSDEIRSELSGISAGLERLDVIEREIRSRD
jgi:hypothetical protein